MSRTWLLPVCILAVLLASGVTGVFAQAVPPPAPTITVAAPTPAGPFKTGDPLNPPPEVTYTVTVAGATEADYNVSIETRGPNVVQAGNTSPSAEVRIENPTVAGCNVVLSKLSGDGYIRILVTGSGITATNEAGTTPAMDAYGEWFRVDGTRPDVRLYEDPLVWRNPTVGDPFAGPNTGILKFYAEFTDESATITGFDPSDVIINSAIYRDEPLYSGLNWWWHDTPVLWAVFPSGNVCPGAGVVITALAPKLFEIAVYPRGDGPISIQIANNPYTNDPAVDDVNWQMNSSNVIENIPYLDAPRVRILSRDSADTNATTMNFTVEFSKPITDFGTGNVWIDPPTYPGVAGGTKTVLVAGSTEPGNPGQRFNVSVSGMTYPGYVRIALNAGAAYTFPYVFLGMYFQANWPSEDVCSWNQVNFDGTAPGDLVVTMPAGLPQPPERSGTYTTSLSKIDIRGTASDDVGIASVTWANDRWLSTDANGYGICTGTTSWTADALSLKPGRNQITITARDAAGNSTSYVLTVECSNNYAYQVVDRPPLRGGQEVGQMGQYTSIAVDDSGNPRIAYYWHAQDNATESWGGLRYAYWDGQAWLTETVDGVTPGSTADDVGLYASLKLDADGNPHISYYDKTNRSLMYAVWKSSAWQTTTVDRPSAAGTDGGVGQYTSLALYNGLPRIAYYDATNKKLKYAAYNGTVWTITTGSAIDSGTDVGQYASLALDPTTGNPRIAYYDASNKDLKYAQFSGSAWSTSSVATVGDVGKYCSLAIDPTTFSPRVSYYDADGKNLAYAAWNGSTWVVDGAVDTAGDVGQYTSLAIHNGLPTIVYYDAESSRQDFKIVRGNAAVSPSWTAITLDDGLAESGQNSSNAGQYGSLAIDSRGNVHASYYWVNNQSGVLPGTAVKYVVSSGGPSCTVQAMDANPTSASPLTFRITFSDPVTGFTADGVAVNGGTAGALTEIAPNDGTAYQILITPLGDGTVTVRVPVGAARHDDLDNQSSNVVSVDVDRTLPTVTIVQDYIQPDPSAGSVINYTVVFSEPVTGFASEDVALGGTAGGAKSVQVTGEGTTYNVAVTGMSTTAGTVIASIPADKAFDQAGNGNYASSTTDDTVWWDGIRPTCTVNQSAGQSDPTNSSVISFTAEFSEPVILFDNQYDVVIGGTASFFGQDGTSKLSVSVSPSGIPDASGHYKIYSVLVSGMQTRGTVTCALNTSYNSMSPPPPPNNAIPTGELTPAYDCAPDGGATAINRCTSYTSTDNVVTYDSTRPTATINQKSDQADPTNALPIRYTVEFSKDVTGFTAEDVTIAGTADLAGVLKTVTGSGKSYVVAVEGVALPAGQTAARSVIASIPAGVATDGAGNTNAAATFSDNTVWFDNRGPAVTVEQGAGQTDSSPDSPVHFTAVFSEPVLGFAPADVTLGGTSTDPQIAPPIVIESDGTFDRTTAAAYLGDTLLWRNDAASAVYVDILNSTSSVIGSLELYPGEVKSFADFPRGGTYTYQVRGGTQPAGTLTVSEILSCTVAQIPPNNGTTYDISVSGMIVPGSVTASLRRLLHISECSPTSVAIPDANTTGGRSSINMSGYSGRIADLNVRLSISHGRDQDLTANLVAPDGTRVELFNHVGKTGASFVNTVLDDESEVSIADESTAFVPFTGWFRPSSALSALDGKDIKGTWTLEVVDDHSGIAGTIQSWCMEATIFDNSGVTDALGNGNEPSTSVDNSVVWFPTPCSTTPVTIPDNNPSGATRMIDLGEYSGFISDLNVKFSINHNYDQDLSGYLIGPDGTTVELFRHVGGNGANFINTVLDDAASQPISSGPNAPFTGSYKPSGLLSVFNGKVITGQWVFKVIDDHGSYTGTIQSWCLQVKIEDTEKPICAVSGSSVATNASPIDFAITFGEVVSPLTIDGMTVTGGTAGMLSGFGTSYVLSVTPDGEGLVTVQVNAGAVHDTCGNYVDETIGTVLSDLSRPYAVVTGITSSPSNANTLQFGVAFNERVTDFTEGDLSVTGTANPTTWTVSDTGDGQHFTIGVSGMTTPGTVIVGVPADVVLDLAGNPNRANSPNDSAVIQYNGIVCTVTGPGALTNKSPVEFSIAFTSAVNGLTIDKIVVVGGTKLSLTPSGASTTYKLLVSPSTGGPVTITCQVPAGAAKSGDNPNSASNTASVVYDSRTVSVTVNQASGQADPTTTGPVNFVALFSKPIAESSFTSNDVTITGTAGGVKTVVVTNPSLDLRTYNIAVSGMSSDGTVVASIAAGVCKDGAGNLNAASLSTDNLVNYDASRPTVSVNQATGQKDPTNQPTVTFTAAFSEPVTGFDAQDVVVQWDGSATQITPVTTVTAAADQKTYSIVIGGLTDSGDVSVSIPEAVCQDAAGNLSYAASSADNTVAIDMGAPNPEINQASGQSDPANVAPIRFTVDFHKQVTGFDVGDVAITGTSGGKKTVSIADDGGGKYTVLVSGMTCPTGSTLPGTVVANIAAGAAQDLAGNASTAATWVDNSVSFDDQGCKVTVEQAVGQVDSTWETSAKFAVVFTEKSADFSDAGVTLGGSVGYTSAKTVTVTNPSGDGKHYEVTVAGFDSAKPGNVTVSVAAGKAHDDAGNGNAASTSVDNSVVFFPAQCSSDIEAIPDNDPDGVDSVLDLQGFSGTIHDMAVNLSITHGFDQDLTATLISPSGTRVVLFSGVGGGGQNFTGTLLMDSATAAISAGAAPFTGTYRPAEPLSEFDGEEINGLWKLEVVDGGAGYTGTVISWCLKLSISDTVAPTCAVTAPQVSACTVPVDFTVTFSEPALGFEANDVTVSTGTVSGVEGSGDTYVVHVTPPASDASIALSVRAAAAYDACGNTNTNAPSATVSYESAPTVTINKAVTQADPTGVTPINFTAFFSKPVTGFTAGDVVVEGTAFGTGTPSVAVSQSGQTYTVAVSGMTQPGTVIASIPAGVAESASGCGNIASTSTDNHVDFDNTPVTVTIDVATGQTDPGDTLPLEFVAHFSKPVADFTSSDVTITGTAGGPKSVTVTGSGQDYTVLVGDITTSGTVVATIAAGVAHDTMLNPNTASTSTKNSLWFDDGSAPAPTVAKADGQIDPAKVGPIEFTVTFNMNVTGFGDDEADVTVDGTAFGAGSTKTVTLTENAGSWTVSVGGMTIPGTVTLSVPAGVAVALGRQNTASAPVTVEFDNVAPTVEVEQATGQADPTASTTIMFTATFSEPVSGLVAADIGVSGTAFGAGAVKMAVVSGGPTVYSIAVSGMNTTGTVFATVPGCMAEDAARNCNAPSTSRDNGVSYDQPASVTINQATGQTDPAGVSPVIFTAVFSEPVVGFGASAVTVTGSAFGSGSPSVVVKGTGPTYTVEVGGMTTSGTVVATIGAGVVKDLGGNGNGASTSTDNSVTYDIDRPDVTVEQADDQADPTNGDSVEFTVVFSKPVVDLDSSSITLSGTAFSASALAAATVGVAGGPSSYDVTVSGMDQTGTVILSIDENQVHDAVGNGNTESTSTDNTVTYDISGPTVTVNQAGTQSDPTNLSPINFIVVFSEPVTDFGAADVTISGAANATTAVVTEVTGGTVYSVAVSGMTVSGPVLVTVAAGAAHDSLGNPSEASTSTDNQVTYDASSLTATMNQSATQLDPTNSGPIRFSVVFSKPVSDFTAGDVTLSGTAPGAKTVIVTGSGTTYGLAVSGMTETGTVSVSIPAGTVHDSAGNPNLEATSTDRVVMYDITAPTITITKPTGETNCTWNCDQLKLSGTADDNWLMGTVTWSSSKGGTGLCTGTSNWSASAVDVVGGGDTFTLTARDAAGNTAIDSVTVTVIPALPGANDWNSLAMVSLPIIPYDQDPKLQVGFYSDYWVAFQTDQNSYVRYPSAATWFTNAASTPGRGFWAGFSGSAAVPCGIVPDQSDAATIHLLPGWNLIGQPFIKSVPWNLAAVTVEYGSQTKNLADAATLGWVKDYAWGWLPDATSTAGGAYYLVCDPTVIMGAIGEMAPWRAYWFKASVECDLIIPAP